MTPLAPGEVGYLVDGPTWLDPALRMLMHHVDGRWLVGGVGCESPPSPGWPPG